MANCKECKEARLNGIDRPATISLFEHESAMTRADRIIKRQWIAIILLIAMLFSCFAIFVWYESQFETISYTQDGGGINNVNLGEQGDLNGAESTVQEKMQE